MGEEVEIGWLLDDGLLCIGLGCNQTLALVTYTNPNAIRFARKCDAEAMIVALKSLGLKITADRLKAVEHSWG